MTKEKIYKYLDGKLVTEMYDDLISFDIPHEKTLTIIEEVTGEKIIRFKDLKFELHPMSFRYDKQKAIRSHGLIKNKWYSIVGGGKGLYGDGVKSVRSYGNIKNKWYSIVGGGTGLYGDGVNNFEVWTEKMESEGLDPFGYSTPEEVEKILLCLYDN